MDFEIIDFKGPRASVGADGTVTRNGSVIGFINADGSAGDRSRTLIIGFAYTSSSENFLGEILTSGKVLNGFEQNIGEFDISSRELRDVNGSFLVSIINGEILDQCVPVSVFQIFDTSESVSKGRVTNSPSPLAVAAYLFFFDPQVMDDGYFSIPMAYTGNGFHLQDGSTSTVPTITRAGLAPLLELNMHGVSLGSVMLSSGEARDNRGNVIGFINADGSAGDAYPLLYQSGRLTCSNENFLGEVGDQIVDGGTIMLLFDLFH